MESLVAGKPVLVSRAIPMADYAAAKGVGVLVEELTADGILEAAEELRRTYDAYAARAVDHGQRNFALAGMLSSYADVYDEVAPLAPGRG